MRMRRVSKVRGILSGKAIFGSYKSYLFRVFSPIFNQECFLALSRGPSRDLQDLLYHVALLRACCVLWNMNFVVIALG